MAEEDVLYRKENGIATITLNRPDKMNALIPEVVSGIYRTMEDAAANEEVRVIIITGTGQAFCSGGDVKAMAERATNPAATKSSTKSEQQRHHLALLFQGCSKPVIAAINGAAVGTGLDVALACDIRIASEKARFAEAYVRRGVLPANGGAYFLPRLVGIDKACQLIFTADIIDAAEAERIGLVTMVVPHEELGDTAIEMAEKIAKNSPQGVQYAKRAIYAGLNTDLETSLDYTVGIWHELKKTEDHKEGTVSFVEKRAPLFQKKSKER